MSFDKLNGYYIMSISNNLTYKRVYIVCKGYDGLVNTLNYYENKFKNNNHQINKTVYLMDSNFETDKDEIEYNDFCDYNKLAFNLNYQIKIDNLTLTR